MSGQSYKLNQPIVSITIVDQQRILATVPRHAIVTVEGRVEGTHLVNVEWKGKRAMIFKRDLRERGSLVDGAVALKLSQERQ